MQRRWLRKQRRPASELATQTGDATNRYTATFTVGIGIGIAVQQPKPT